MVKISMHRGRGDEVEWLEAWRVLARMRAKLSGEELDDWKKDGKKKFLMGERHFGRARVAIPLNEFDAEQAIEEYQENGF